MQAILKTQRDVGTEIREVPRPTYGPREVLIRVKKTGICGTDRHIYEWDAWAAGRIKPPVVIGHEFVGIIEETGKDVTWAKPGDRVSAEGHIVCGKCFCCRTGKGHICNDVKIIGVDTNGCFAPYVVMPECNLWKVDPSISDDQACLFDPFGNAMHTVGAQEVRGKSVLIVGCGAIGLMAIGIASAHGAEKIIAVEPNPFKRTLAKQMGADVILKSTDEAAIKRETGDGVDVLLEMSGYAPAIVEGLRCVRNGGEVALLGIPAGDVPIPWASQIVFKALTLRGINGRRMYDTWYQCESILRKKPGLMEPCITHRLPFDKFEEGIKAMQDGSACKVVLDWSNART